MKSTEVIQTTQAIEKKNKYNYKLSAEDKQQITLEYYINRSSQSIQELCTKYNISTRRLYQIVNEEKNNEKVNEYITQCKKNFSKKSQIIIDKALNKIQENIQNDNVNNKDLITITGILYDKNRLEQNLSTSNNAISINIKVE